MLSAKVTFKDIEHMVLIVSILIEEDRIHRLMWIPWQYSTQWFCWMDLISLYICHHHITINHLDHILPCHGVPDIFKCTIQHLYDIYDLMSNKYEKHTLHYSVSYCREWSILILALTDFTSGLGCTCTYWSKVAVGAAWHCCYGTTWCEMAAMV